MAVTVAAPVHRLSYEDVLAMVRDGTLDEDARVELIEGVLTEMNPAGAGHESTLALLTRHLARHVAERLEVRVQAMLLIAAGGYVLPDLLVIEDPSRKKLPRTAVLAIEIAQTSQARDRDKVATYATAAVAEHWIVDLVAELVTVHRDPADGGYRSVIEHRDGALAPQLDGVPPIELDRLFGR